MINLLSSRQIGNHYPRVLQQKEINRRSKRLKLCEYAKLQKSEIGGFNIADIDAIENRYLLAGGSTGGVAIHDLHKSDSKVHNTCVSVVEGSSRHAHKLSIQTIQWYPLDTGLFITGGADKVLKIWDTNTLRPADSYELNGIVSSHDLSSVATSHSLLAVATQSSRVKLIDLKSGSATHILKGHKADVVCVQWSRTDEYLLASAGKDGRVMLWDVRTAKGHLRILSDTHSQSDATTSHQGTVNCISFTNDGLHLISAGTDNTIKLWDTYTWEKHPVRYNKIKNQTLKAVSVAHTNSRRGLLYIPEETDIQVYDIQTGRHVDTLSGHFNNVNFCVYRHDYQELYSGAHDKKILIWVSGLREDVSEKCVRSVDEVSEVKVEVKRDEWSSEDEL